MTNAEIHTWERIPNEVLMKCSKCGFVWEPQMQVHELPKICVVEKGKK